MESIAVEEDNVAADECSPELVLDAVLSQERLNQALARMSPMMRAAVLLRTRTPGAR